jgi:hypothetical protein
MEKKKFGFTICVFSALLIILQAPVTLPAQCTSDADCNDGVYYNGM